MPERALSAQLRSGDQTVCEAPAVPAGDTPSAFLEVATYPAGERMVVVVSGEIDIDTDQVLQRALREALAHSISGVDLDLTGVDFCDCSGLNVLLCMRRYARDVAKTLDIQAAGPVVGRLLTLTHTSSLFAPARGAHIDMAVNGRHKRPCTTHSPPEEAGLPDDDEKDLRIEVVQLKRAMQTRPVIDLARGVLMASFGLSPEDAWNVLVAVSQHTNTKLHHLAQELVGAVNGEPLPEPLQQQLSTAVTEVFRSGPPGVQRHDPTLPSYGSSQSDSGTPAPHTSQQSREQSPDLI